MNTPSLNTRRWLMFLLVSSAFSLQVKAQTWSGGDIGNSQNWSDGNNWAGNVAPTSSGAVVFPDGIFPLTTNTQGVVNNIVQSSMAVGSLTFNNQDKNFDTTEIPAAVALTVSGNLSIGASDATGSNTVVTMTGGGSLFAGTSGAATLSGQNGSGQNTASTLDMSGLGNFTFNAGASSPGSVNLGTGSSGSSITVDLAAQSNLLTASTLNIGNNNTRGTVVLNLGNSTNIIHADTINMGISKTAGTMQFLNNAGGGLSIANHTGTGRATFVVSGQANTGTTTANNNGFLLFDGGTVNILASTMTLGNRTSRGGGGTATGTLAFNNGSVDATTINLALNTSGGDAATGNLDVGGPGVLKIGTGGLSMANQGGTAGAGNLILTNGGTVTCAGNIYKTTSIGIANIVSSDSSLSIAGTIGVSNSIPIDNFSITNSTFTLPVSSSANVALVNLNADAATQNTINVSSMPAIAGPFPVQFPIISYQVGSGNLGSFVLGTLPGLPGTFTGFISNNTTALSIDLVVISGPIAKADTWTGAVNTLWDTTTQNWTTSGLATNYNDLDQVTFDDTAATGSVNITAARTPATINGLTFNNTSLNYTLTGVGRISGAASLVKNNAALLTLSETGGDNFSGGITVNGGTLVLDDANGSISGGLTINAGTTVQIGNNDSVGNLPSGTLDNEGTLIFDRTNNLTVGTAIPGGGALVQNGNGVLTLTGTSTYSGATIVNSGTLALSGGGAITSSSSVNVTNAILDVSGVTTSAALPATTLSGATVNVKIGYVQTNFTVNGLTNIGINTINVRSLPPIAFYPATNVLVQSSSAIVGNNFTLGTLPTATPAYVGSLALSSDGTTVFLVLTAGPIGVRPTVTWSGVDALGAVSTNWSDAQNWQSPGTPVIGERVTFNNTAVANGTPFDQVGDGPGGVQNPASINNIVDINSTNAGVNYANGGNFHNTLVNPGKSLNVAGPLTVTGGGGTVSILGVGGTLTMTNPAGASILNVENGTTPILDMSGLDTFTATVSQIGVGLDIPSTGTSANGTWYMAKTNVITTSSGFSGVTAALVVGGVNNQSGTSVGTLYLGQTNELFVDGIAMGPGPSVGDMMLFNPAVTNDHPGVYIRGITGNASRVTQWSLGDATVNLNNHTPGGQHITDFSPGVVNALVDTFDVGQGSQCNTLLPTNEYTATFNMGAGILDVTTLRIGLSGSGSSGDGIGIMNVTGGTVLADNLMFAVGTQTSTSGTLNLTNATLVLSNGISVGTGNAGGTLSVIGSKAELLSGSIGSPTGPLTTLNLDTGTLQLVADANEASADIVAGAISATNLTTINLAAVTNVTGTAQIPLISYANSALDPYTNLVLGAVPAGYTVGNGGALVDNTGNLSIDVILSTGAGPSTNANITHVFLSSGNLVIQGTNNNVPNTNFHYAVLTSTNVALPLTNWTIVSTNGFNPDGTFDYTNPIVPGTLRQFIDVLAVP